MVKRPKRGRPRKVRGRGRPTLAATERKRVEILKDAVKQLKLERYVTNQNGYIQFYDNDEIYSAINASEILTGKKAHEISAKKLIDQFVTSKKPCDVCAKGALTISAIRKYNACSLNELSNLDDNASVRARRIFGTANADLMEQFYEDWSHELSDDELKEKCHEWHEMYPDANKRLIAIFENAIKNKGIFKP